MADQTWHPTACNLCYANCGVLVQLDESSSEIMKVKGDKAHPASQGYTCNKAAAIKYYQHSRDRLTSPLRRTEDGNYEKIDWDTAINEIADKLNAIRNEHGGDKVLFYGGGSQGNHLGGAHSSSLMGTLGIKYRSSAIAQEKTGFAWIMARLFGGMVHGDFHHCDVAVIVGKNPWQSNGMQRARIQMRDISKAADKTLIVFDPKKTETAKLADIHFAVKPGTDAWALCAIMGHMVQNDMIDTAWLNENAEGQARILEQFAKVPVQDFTDFAGIDIADVHKAAEALSATNKVAIYEDLGIQMAPNSTLVSYLNFMVPLLRGSFDRDGGMMLLNSINDAILKDRVYDIDEDGYEHGRPVTPVTGAPINAGLMPCVAIPDEIQTDHPDRFRAMIVESSNPLHSLPDSPRFREAFRELELSVVIDVAFTETAMEADYVLPAASAYEKYEATFFPAEAPDNFFHLRKPLFEPLEGTLEEAEIYSRLIEALGAFEPGELDQLKDAARQGLPAFTMAMGAAMTDRKIKKHLTYVLHRTLGAALPDGMGQAAAVWGLCLRLAMKDPQAVNAAGHEGAGPMLGNVLFDAILNGHSGVTVTSMPPGDPKRRKMPNGKVQMLFAELNDELDKLWDYDLPARTDEFPMVLAAGERRTYTAMTSLRNVEWYERSNDAGSLAVNSNDAKAIGLNDGGKAKLITKRGDVEVRVRFDDDMQEGTMSLPNGLGTWYPDENGTRSRTGVAPNEITSLEDADPFVGSPWHKYVRARLEKVS